MPSARMEGVFEELKKLLSPGSIWPKVWYPNMIFYKVVVPQPQSSKYPKKFSYPFANFTIVFLNYVQKWYLAIPK